MTILSLLLLLFVSLFFNFQFLPLHTVLTEDADALFIEELARDLNQGGFLFDWHLPQAPYLFPDLLVARMLAPMASNVGDISIYYHSVYGVLLFLLIFWICRICSISALPVSLVAVALYSTTFIGGLSGDALTLYFGLINHHSGVAAIVLLVFGSVLCHIRAEQDQHLFLFLLFVFVFLGVISDSIIVIAVLPPLFFYCAIMHLKKSAATFKAVQVVIAILVATLSGKMFGLTNPFPQDRLFLEKVIALLPWRLPVSLERFPADFYTYFTGSIISAFVAVCFFGSLVLAVFQIIDILRNRSRADSPIALFSYFIVMSPMFVIALQLGLGLYHGIESSRQWAPLVYLAIVFGAIICVNRSARSVVLLKWLVVAVLLGLVTLVISTMHNNRGVTREENSFSAFVDCMRENELPEGPYYIANYWAARPIRLYSDGMYEVFSYYRLDGPFNNAANIVRARKATPKFIIAGYFTRYQDVVERFGPPVAEYCKMRVGSSETFKGRASTLRILDYRNNPEVQARLKEQFENADREP